MERRRDQEGNSWTPESRQPKQELRDGFTAKGDVRSGQVLASGLFFLFLF